MSDTPKQTVTIDLPYFIEILTRCTTAEVTLGQKEKDYNRLYCENVQLKEQLKEAAK